MIDEHFKLDTTEREGNLKVELKGFKRVFSIFKQKYLMKITFTYVVLSVLYTTFLILSTIFKTIF